MIDLSYYSKQSLYLVAVSGGPDSMALLDMLYHQNFNLIVALVNYKKRVESDEEQQMVQHYCDEKNIRFFTTEFKKMNTCTSFQAQAREFRYSFFNELYEKYHCDGLFVAHHKDDVIETYLLKKQRHVINQSYLIEPKTTIKKMIVHRPLLRLYKEELLSYCKQHQVPYRIDKSNFSTIYPRNAIRQKLQIMDKELLYQEALLEESHLQQTRQEVFNYLQNNQTFSIEELKNKNDLFLQLFLYQVVDTPFKHCINKNVLSKLRCFIYSEKPNLKHKIEKNYYMVKVYDFICFKFLEESINYCYVVHDFTCFETPYFIVANQGKKMEGIFLTPEDFPIKIRNCQPGDVIEQKIGTKKLTRLFIDKKIPVEIRNRLPIIENCQGKILFVSGIYRYFKLKLTQNNFFVLEYKK